MISLESRKDNQFTYAYSQPAEYHFCLDSIILAEFVADIMKEKVTSETRVLDLCAGCGVVGFELKYRLSQIQSLDFVELQVGFEKHFLANLEITSSDPHEFKFLNADLRDFIGEYDLIICNPPYFDPLAGKLGESEFKNRCHFFTECKFVDVLNTCVGSLATNGEAFILVKNEQLASTDLSKYLKAANFQVMAKIRGTNVLRVQKLLSTTAV